MPEKKIPDARGKGSQKITIFTLLKIERSR